MRKKSDSATPYAILATSPETKIARRQVTVMPLQLD
jgi:hypothetical protein